MAINKMDLNAQQLISELIEYDLVDSRRVELEDNLKAYPKDYASYLKLRKEYLSVFPHGYMEANPYMYQKIVEKIREETNPSLTRRLSWLPYAAIVSFGILSGVFLGSQVIVDGDDGTDQISDLTIGEYELEDVYLIGFADE